MRNALPTTKPKRNEAAIVNLDDRDNAGTHWVAYIKRGRTVYYFDSFGDLPPPRELVSYFGKNVRIKYNHERVQDFNSYTCGHWCLKFLINNSV